MSSSYNIALFSGTANKPLSRSIASRLNKKLNSADIGRYNDGEISVKLNSSIRGYDVYIIQPTCPPTPSDNLMEILVMIDAVKRSSAKRTTAVLPYFGYGRQDRRPWSQRVPITAKLVANMLTAAGADRILTVDLHADQIQGFFNIPVDNLYASPIFTDLVKKMIDKPTVVSPDIGGVVRARALAKQLDTDLVIIDKRRPKDGVSEVMNIIGDVQDKSCVIFDDIVDTAGTLCKGAEALKKNGAKSVIACCTHGVLSANAIDNIDKSNLDAIYVSNTIPLNAKAKSCNKIKEVCISELIASSIERIHNEDSIRSMYPKSME